MEDILEQGERKDIRGLKGGENPGKLKGRHVRRWEGLNLLRGGNCSLQGGVETKKNGLSWKKEGSFSPRRSRSFFGRGLQRSS